MKSQWNTSNDTVPARLGQPWDKSKNGDGTGRVVAIAAGVVAVVLIIAFVTAMATNPGERAPVSAGGDANDAAIDEAGEPAHNASFPGEGKYFIQVAHTGYCVGAGEPTGAGDHVVLQQMACGEAEPEIQLIKTSTKGMYTIHLLYPDDDYTACLTVDGLEADNLFTPQECDGGEEQLFTLVPAADEKDFHVVAAGGLCMGVRDASPEANAEFGTAECSSSLASQRFSFDGDGTVPTRPTKLGAWWARDGVYAAEWQEPNDDGGLEITEYVVRDCDGKELGTVAGDEMTIEVEADKLTCMSVRAVNDAGEGDEATFDIEGK